MPSPPAAAASSSAPKKKERRWAPRMWIGMGFATWIGLLVRNRFQVSPVYWHKAVLITIVSVFNSLLCGVEWLIFGRAVARTKIHPQPLIILGHWRSGTTWLHELLAADPQFTSPTTYQALAPNHFLATQSWVTKLFFWLLPSRRPMDNMPMGWERPQEDEFALCNLGESSPYLTVAFPNNPPVYSEYLTLDVPPEAEARWRRTLHRFLQKVTYADPKRIILKSPPHTARVRTLLEMFPEARFVYLVRNPFVIFSSTVHLWQKLYEAHGLQVPTFAGLEEQVFTTFTRIHDRFEAERNLIPSGRLYELKYEELVQDPTGQMAAIYERLQLGDFSKVRPAVERYVTENADYRTNSYQLKPELRDQIAKRWSRFIEQYGYTP